MRDRRRQRQRRFFLADLMDEPLRPLTQLVRVLPRCLKRTGMDGGSEATGEGKRLPTGVCGHDRMGLVRRY